LHKINICCLGTNVVKFKGVVSKTLNERKCSSHLNCIDSTCVVIVQMPLDSSILVARTQNESKGLLTSIVHNQNHNNGKRPQNIKKVMPTSTAQKSTFNVLGLIIIMKNSINQLTTHIRTKFGKQQNRP